MASLLDSGVPSLRAAPTASLAPAPRSVLVPPWTRQQWLLAGLGLLALHVGHLLAWRQGQPPLWSPPAGIGLVLIAWLGPRGALVIVLDALLALVQRQFAGPPVLVANGWPALVLDGGCGGLDVLQALAGWWLYHRAAGGSRRLDDPRSATLFLFLVPGLTAGLFALLRAVPYYLLGPEDISLGQWALAFWISQALGILALIPLLLAVVTPWLVRRGVLADEQPFPSQPCVDPAPGRLLRGDWIELAGLALGTGVLGLLLNRLQGFRETGEWQLWGASLLLIVWASVRQGLRGGIVVAAAAAVVPLTLVSLQGGADRPSFLLQGSLLAQCGAGLLVTASANWVRGSEARYRRVVGHIPVVLYSARVVQAGQEGRPPTATISFVSPACQEILGCPQERLLGSYENWLERVHPQDREVVLAALMQLNRQQAPVTCEYRLAGSRGPADATADALTANAHIITVEAPRPREYWLRDTLVPVFGADGVLEGWDGVVSDITQQRVLADDLRNTTSMFYTLVANLPAGVFFVHAPSGRPILVNTRARQLLGQREDSSAGLEHLPKTYHLHRPDGSAYPADELPVTLAVRQGLTAMRDDIVVHRPDGRRLPLVTWAAPIDLRGQGQTQAAVWVFEDLTALHQAEAARRESETRLRAVVETMAEGLVVQDATGTITECNPAAAVVHGVPGERLRGRSLLTSEWRYLREDGSLLPLEEHPAQVSMQTGQPVRDVVLGIALPPRLNGHTPNGAAPSLPPVRWVLVSAMPLPSSLGRSPGGVVTTFADITAHRQAQEVLRASEEKYRGLVETLPLMALQFDREARVTYVNPATETITGYDLNDLRGTGWESVVCPEDLPRARSIFSEVLAGQTVRTELRCRAKDGRDLVGYLIAQPRRQSGQVIGVTALVVDMTRERRLERELQRSQRLELIGRLSSGIAHDFNNLLNVILTLTELVQANLPSEHPARADLRRITEAGEQAAGLAGQLLAFSKQRRTVAQRVDVNRVARRTAEMLRAALPASIELEPALSTEQLLVQADEMQLHQVLMNLCLNARDAMPEGGRLILRTEGDATANGNGHAGGSWVRVSVQDNGEGMSDIVKGRIFDPFFSTKEHGTGLGLAVVQQIVESHGGEVKVWSEPGAGSRFEIWLPCAQEALALV